MHHLCEAETFLTDGLGKPGRFQPDQPGPTGLTPDKQPVMPAVRCAAVGSEFCLRNAADRENIYTAERVLSAAGLYLLGREAAALADRVLSAAFVPHVRSAWRQNPGPDD